MSYMNQNQGGYQQGGYQQSKPKAPRKEKINEWTGIGIVRPRSANENDPITFYDFKNNPGEGCININLSITEFTGTSDENGNPRQRHTSVPVSVRTNKSITAAQLRSVIAGMKVRVVGRLELQSYKNKQGQDVSSLNVNAYVFEILEMPMQSVPQYGAPQGGYPPYPQNGAAYQQSPYQQPGYPAQPPQQAYPPMPGYQPGMAQPASPQQSGYMPPQYPAHAPQGVMPTPPYYQNGGMVEDLPLK